MNHQGVCCSSMCTTLTSRFRSKVSMTKHASSSARSLAWHWCSCLQGPCSTSGVCLQLASLRLQWRTTNLSWILINKECA